MPKIERFISKSERDNLIKLDVNPNDYQDKISEIEQLSRITDVKEKILYARKLKAKYGNDFSFSIGNVEI